MILTHYDREYDFYEGKTDTLIIALHGWGQSIHGFNTWMPKEFQSSFQDFSEIHTLGHHTAYLQAQGKVPGMIWQVPSWKFNDAPNNIDVKFVSEVTYLLRHKYQPRRVFLFGFSQGGMLLDVVLKYYAAMYHGFVRHSSSMWIKSTNTSLRRKVYCISGDSGFIEGQAQKGTKRAYDFYTKAGHNTKLVTVNGNRHQWAKTHTQDMVDWLDA